MESTIEKLVDNLEDEKGLNSEEKDELDRVLRTAAKGIEPDRIADFVKSMRQKIDAPVSKIFTKEGINFENLEGAAQTEAKNVIKIQNEYAEKRKQENQQSNITDENEKVKAEEKAKQLEKEIVIAENEEYLDKYMPNLENTTKKRTAERMYNAREFVKMCRENGRNLQETAKDLGLSSSDTAFTELHILLNVEQEQKQMLKQNAENKNPNESRSQQQIPQSETVRDVSNVFDVLEFLSDDVQEVITTDSNGNYTEESLEKAKHLAAEKAIKELREEILKIQNEIQENSEINEYAHNLITLFEKLEKKKIELRDAIRIDEEAREKLGEKDAVDRERAQRQEFKEKAKERYFKRGNRETLIMIYEDMRKDAESKGIKFDEIVGFDDIFNEVLAEIEKYPEQLNNYNDIKKFEEENYQSYIEQKAIDIVKNNVDNIRQELLYQGKTKEAERYDSIRKRHAKDTQKLATQDLKNMDKTSDIRMRVSREIEKRANENEIVRRENLVDMKKMSETKDSSEFIANITKLYFGSRRSVSEIYDEFKENCTTMGISFEDIVEAVSKEARKQEISTNADTIRDYEKTIRKLSISIAILKEKNRIAEKSNNKSLIDKNNEKIKKYQEKIDKKRDTTTTIKRLVVLRKVDLREKSQQKNVEQPSTGADTKQEKRPEPKKKKGLFSFLRRAIPKKEIEPKDVNEETTTLNDLQREEVQEDKEQPKAVNENKTNNKIEVSTISVDGDEVATETTNKHLNEPEKSDAEEDVR